MRLVVRVTTCVLLTMAAAQAQAQTGPVRATFGGRMHFQWNATSVGASDLAPGAVRPASSTFEQRRIRLSADVQVGDWIEGRIEPEFAMGRLSLRTAWLAFELDSLLVVRAGQMKRPYGLIFNTSSGVLPVIERGVRIRGLDGALRASDTDGRLSELRGELLPGEHFALVETHGHSEYDMGVTAEGSAGALAWTAGIFNGSGPDTRAEAAGLSAVARATWQAPVAAPLRLGAAWSRRSMDWPVPGAAETRTGNAFGVDVEYGAFRRGGLWILAEASTGDDMVAGDRFTGAQLMTAYFVPTAGGRIEGWEPAGRASYGDPTGSVSGDEGVLLTPGINVYFPGRNRFMVNWDVYLPAGDGFSTQHALRAQLNLHF